jgi:hypothetical protein
VTQCMTSPWAQHWQQQPYRQSDEQLPQSSLYMSNQLDAFSFGGGWPDHGGGSMPGIVTACIGAACIGAAFMGRPEDLGLVTQRSGEQKQSGFEACSHGNPQPHAAFLVNLTYFHRTHAQRSLVTFLPYVWVVVPCCPR